MQTDNQDTRDTEPAPPPTDQDDIPTNPGGPAAIRRSSERALRLAEIDDAAEAQRRAEADAFEKALAELENGEAP